VAQTSYTRNF